MRSQNFRAILAISMSCCQGLAITFRVCGMVPLTNRLASRTLARPTEFTSVLCLKELQTC
jgi:hypothetical protein